MRERHWIALAKARKHLWPIITSIAHPCGSPAHHLGINQPRPTFLEVLKVEESPSAALKQPSAVRFFPRALPWRELEHPEGIESVDSFEC
jgi:hypothetical protein